MSKGPDIFKKIFNSNKPYKYESENDELYKEIERQEDENRESSKREREELERRRRRGFGRR